MKIGIVTVYNSLNYGAFFQAFAMKELLETEGHTVYFIKHNVRKPFIYTIEESGYKLLCGQKRLKEFIYAWKKYFRYKRDWTEFTLCRKGSKNFGELDIILYGSDEIWNVKRKLIYKYPVLFGKGFEDYNKVAYGASVNNASVEDFKKFPELIECMKSFRYIAVRGENSRKVISEVLDKEVEVVLDPTLLVDKSFYDKIENKYEKEKYILIYSYSGTISEEMQKEIIQYARIKGYKLVSVLSYISWCDDSPQLSAGELVGCFRRAEVIITNTFHGVALSIAFRKEFIAIVNETQVKIMEMLKTFGLIDRRLDKNDRISQLVEKKIDYEVIYQYLYSERERCKEIMDNFLGM